MSKLLDILYVVWELLVGVLEAFLGLFKPKVALTPAKPPEPQEARDHVAEQKEQKHESDKKVDDMSRAELVDDINTEYGGGDRPS